MQKFWIFFPVTSCDKSTWRPLERRHKRLYACFHKLTLPNCRKGVRLSPFQCQGRPGLTSFPKIAFFQQFPYMANLDDVQKPHFMTAKKVALNFQKNHLLQSSVLRLILLSLLHICLTMQCKQSENY